ncbi:MAG: ORF6N domain-containing protein [Flavobacteriales bacterium]|nr:ORF6N domain-containing protein [Flavobacteriales bacterium]
MIEIVMGTLAMTSLLDRPAGSQRALVTYAERAWNRASIVREPDTPYHLSMFADQRLARKVHVVRGQHVMLDVDLAAFYGVRIRDLRAHVRRNKAWFPEGCMFTLTTAEVQAMLSSHSGRVYASAPVSAFNECGILSLATVLRTEQAAVVSLRLVGLFLRMRDLLIADRDIHLHLDRMAQRAGGEGGRFHAILQDLEKLLAPEQHSA